MVSFNKSSEAEGVAASMPNVTVQFRALGGVGALVGAALAWAMVGDALAVCLGLGVYVAAMGLADRSLRASYPHRAIGLCNVATMARLVLVSVLVAAAVAPAPPWVVFAVALIAFAMDGLDGWLARREGYASAFGARFDMEVDSGLALVLALLAWQSGHVGVYVIILGLPRYAFWITGFAAPWLNGPLPERFSRKVVCVVQIAALIIVLVPFVTAPIASGVAGLAALALVWSFTLDVRLLWQTRA